MNLSRIQSLYPHSNFRHIKGAKIGLLLGVLAGAAVILFTIGYVKLSHITGATWQLDIFVVILVAVPVIAIANLIIRQVRATLSRYAEFVEMLGDEQLSELTVEQSSKELQQLGAALNKTHQRLQIQQTKLQSGLASHNQFSRLVEDSPNIVLLMNADGEVKYLNARGRQVADAAVVGGEDLSVILPQTPAALVEKCIVNNETLLDQEVNYRDRKFSWTLIPLRDEKMLQAHGTVVPRRRKVDFQSLDTGAEGKQSRLYSIDRHPDYQRYRGSILVIDNDDMMQSLISRFLKKEGFHIFSAYNGEEGLEMAERYRPDLITLDIMMPGKNGWMVLSALKDKSKVANIPVVIVSSVGNKRFVHAMGADDYVSKPIDWEALGKTINRLSSDSRKMDSFQ
ncbi:MAG: response regulator [Acidiferrobacterales bacterium]